MPRRALSRVLVTSCRLAPALLVATATLAGLAAKSGAEPAADGRTYNLRPSLTAGSVSQVETILQVGGDAQLADGTRKTALPMSVVANLDYTEKLLDYADASQSRRSIRYYENANVVIKVDKGAQKPKLRDDRRLIAVEAGATSVDLYSPQGPLTRDELDLLEIPGNSLILNDILPTEEIAVGGTWTHSDKTMAALLGLDAVSAVKVTSRLTEVADGVAKLVAEGSLKGAAAGIGTEMEIKAKYNYDFKLKRIVWFALLVKEKRAIGHIGPGLDVVAKLIMKVTPATDPVHLPPDLVSKLPASSEGLKLLEYESPTGTFGFAYNRNWFITSDEKNIAVLRMVDRGELVAQCNISPLADVQKQITLAEYQQEIQHTLGKGFGQFLEASEDATELGYQIYRVVATGEVSGLGIEWVYYLITNRAGQRVSLAFTLESDLKERFAAADRELVGSLRFMQPAIKAATRPPGVR